MAVEHEADLHTAFGTVLRWGQFLEKKNCNAPATFCHQCKQLVILVEMKSDFTYMIFNIRFFSFLSYIVTMLNDQHYHSSSVM